MVGVNLREAGEFERAISQLELCLKIRRMSLGDDHKDTLYALNSLGVTYSDARLPGKAKAVYEELLERRSRLLGPKDPATLNAKSGLALALRDLGMLKDAHSMLELVLQIQAARLPADHNELLATQEYIALTLLDQNETSRAVSLLEGLLIKRQGRPENPRSFQLSRKLAIAYKKMGRVTEAISILEPLIDQLKTRLGDIHPETYEAINSLATAYIQVNRSEDGLNLLQEFRVRLENDKVPKSNQRWIGTMHNLAWAMRAHGKPKEAVAIYDELYQTITAQRGHSQHDALAVLNNLGLARQEAGDAKQAIADFQKVLNQQSEVDERDTLTTRSNLGLALLQDNQTLESIKLLASLKQSHIRLLGEQRPDTIRAIANLGFAYQANKQPQMAIAELELACNGLVEREFRHEFSTKIVNELISSYEKIGNHEREEYWLRLWSKAQSTTYGKDSSEHANVLAALAHNLIRQRKWSDAEPSCRECLTIRRRTIPQSWLVYNTQSMLGEVLYNLKQLERAESELRVAADGLLKHKHQIPPAAQDRVREAVNRLIMVYEVLDNKPEVARWQTLLKQLP